MILLVSRALAHGGEDHGAPPPPAVTADATRVSVAASSAQFEAVLRLDRGPAGSPVAATLLLDDYATSTPTEGATPSVTLTGPGTVSIDFTLTTPGTYTGMVTFPADGDYAGALVVTTPTTSDLLSISGVHLGEAPAAAGGSGLLGGLAVAAVLGVAALVILGLGFLLGRRRGATAAVTFIGLAFGTRHVWAHGGEEHAEGVPATPNAGSGGLHLPMESQFLVGLRTAKLVHDNFQEQIPALGRFVARPGGSAALRSPVGGELVAPPGGFPSPGSVVHAGQVLANVRELVGSSDRASLAQERQQAVTAVAEAKKALALAERDAAQAANLAGSISDRERLEREQAVEVARASLTAAERTVAAIGDGTSVAIRAPFEGRLGAVLARPGDQVQPGDALFRVVDASGLWVESRVPERLVAGVAAGAPARVVATAFPDAPLVGTVLDAGQEADTTTGTLTVTLAVTPADGTSLHPGMSATAWLRRGSPRDVLVVPDAAVVDSSGMSLAFVKVGPEQFELRELKLGARSGDAWEVLAGLKVGERVVTDGTYTLRSLAGR